jgi:hypothetical protein
MKPWYQCTVIETQAYFDTNTANGLTAKSVFARLKHFGKNLDASLSPEVSRAYNATVIRQGQPQAVNLQHIVPGDVVALKPGDRVPADLRLFKVERLEIDESMLGTSGLPVAKNTYAISQTTPLNKQQCMAFSGTFVVKGRGWGMVVARGADVAYKPPLQKLPKKGIKNNLIARRLHRYGLAIGRYQDIEVLPKIDMLFFDIDLGDTKIAELIRKVQLIKKIPCKFMVSEAQAKRLQAELAGVKIAPANSIVKLTPMNMVDMVEDTQFIVNADPADALKIIKVLGDNGVKVMLISDGQKPQPAMQITALSLVLGNSARDDVAYRASLIAPSVDVSMLASIFYNRK